MSQRRGSGPDEVERSKEDVVDPGLQLLPARGSELTYELYYGLRSKPFSLATDPPGLYRSATHAPAVESLLGALRRREGIIVLTGAPGTGKTTLCRAAVKHLDRRTLVSHVHDPSLSREDLLRTMLIDFGEVSVNELQRGCLAGASRLDLSYRLRQLLESLEPSDTFAMLVIEEADRLTPPLVDEILALLEMEAGGTPLQVVLVGGPELRSRLEEPPMRQIDQRVTSRCELRPLLVDEVADYVAHRLVMVQGSSARVAFAPKAIETIHAVSGGVPRLINVICDRAMARGHLERTSVIGPPVLAAALDELRLTAPRRPADPVRPVAEPVQPPHPVQTPAPASSVSPPPVPENPRGLFEKRPVSDSAACDLDDLLELPAVSPQRHHDGPSAHRGMAVFPTPLVDRGAFGERSRRDLTKAVALVAVGMAAMSIIGGIAVTAQRLRPSVVAPAPPVAAAPVAAAAADAAAAVPAAVTSAVAVDPPPSPGEWAVQVAAFESPARASAAVEELTELGFPAFEVESTAGTGDLPNVVRVGPFETPAEADEAAESLSQLADFQDAFVLNLTTR